jgi:sarcosine oxidase subunit beta
MTRRGNDNGSLPEKADVIVVGAGLIGASVAYHLSRFGINNILVEQGRIGGQASGGNFGRIQVQDAEPGLSLDLTVQGCERFYSGLEEELGFEFEFRPSGYLLLATNGHELRTLLEAQEVKEKQGLKIRYLDPHGVAKVEPELECACSSSSSEGQPRVLGGTYHVREGQVNPIKLVLAYTAAAERLGTQVFPHTRVLDIDVSAGKVSGVYTDKGRVSAQTVVLATGAWAPNLLNKFPSGRDMAIHHVIGEAFVTEPIGPFLKNGILVASFFEGAHSREGLQMNLCMAQTASGNLLVGEASRVVTEAPDLTHRLDGLQTAFSIPTIAREASKLFPILKTCSIIRSWSARPPFTPDSKPALGFLPSPKGVMVATGFKSTVVVTPVIGDIVARTIRDGKSPIDISEFSPVRPALRPFAANDHVAQ